MQTITLMTLVGAYSDPPPTYTCYVFFVCIVCPPPFSLKNYLLNNNNVCVKANFIRVYHFSPAGLCLLHTRKYIDAVIEAYTIRVDVMLYQLASAL